MLTTIAAMAIATTSVPYDANDEAAATTWIAQDGHRFNPTTLSPSDLSPLVQHLSGARVVGIGEATHGTHQDEAFKVELIKALVRAGAIDVVAIECNRTAGYAFDRYVRFGEGDPAALIRSPSFFSIWRNDAFGDLLLWLRAWNQVSRRTVRMIGIDDQDTSADAAYALSFLERHDSAEAKRLAKRIGDLMPAGEGKRVFLVDWVGAANKAKLEGVTAAAIEVERKLAAAPAAWRADAEYDEAVYAARVARQGLAVFAREYRGSTEDRNDVAYQNLRDGYMAANLIERTGQGRAALWAHDMHVASAMTAAEEKTGYRNVGTALRAILGPAYKAVGFTWSRATLNIVNLPADAPAPTFKDRRYGDLSLRNDCPGEWGHVFSPLGGDAWWIALGDRPHSPALDRWGARNLWHGWMGWRVDPAHWQDDESKGSPNPPDRGFDVIVWFREMGPSHAWPEPAS